MRSTIRQRFSTSWGRLEARDQHAIGVVGSRRTTHYGLECAKKLSYQIAYSGLTVVSGLARGIDTAAHQGALAAKGRTVAVLGTGLHHLYPAENRALAEKIASCGALVTEFSMETTPDRQTFPMRNRIISGWGFGLLVVEAGMNSGALISASQAADQGRNLYAVPGPIDRPTSHGTNRLIQQGAKLVMSVDDILEDVQTLFPKVTLKVGWFTWEKCRGLWEKCLNVFEISSTLITSFAPCWMRRFVPCEVGRSMGPGTA